MLLQQPKCPWMNLENEHTKMLGNLTDAGVEMFDSSE